MNNYSLESMLKLCRFGENHNGANKIITERMFLVLSGFYFLREGPLLSFFLKKVLESIQVEEASQKNQITLQG